MLRILKETRHWMAVDKPAGVICQAERLNGLPHTDTLLGLLNRHRPDLFDPRQHQPPFHPPKTVHRLDKHVTGVLLVGLSVVGVRTLSRLFRERRVWKEYVGLVRGEVMGDSFGLVRNEDGETRWRVLERARDRDDGNTLLALNPVTGRKHQLRKHCALVLGHPIVGDRRYGDNPSNHARFAQKGDLERLMLHCRELRFRFGLESYEVTSNECADLRFFCTSSAKSHGVEIGLSRPM